MRARLTSEAQQFGGVHLVIIDTSAAYFLGNEEMSNTQMGAHARTLRWLTTLPGGPCVVPLCHPIKHASDRSHLLPRGGGAFLAEMDGNLTAWKHDDNLIELHHNKIRGPGFEPITFRVESITTTQLVDSKGRLLPTVRAVPISDAEEKREGRSVRADQDKLLTALLDNADRSVAELARACGFTLANGEPHKSKIQRRLADLKGERLVRHVRGRWALTDEGDKAAKELRKKATDEVAELRGGAPDSKLEFFAVKGKKVGASVPCCHCGNADGNVFKIKDGRVSKGHYEALHAVCARNWFEGKPTPKPAPQVRPDFDDF
jgi:hypothetical protein